MQLCLIVVTHWYMPPAPLPYYAKCDVEGQVMLGRVKSHWIRDCKVTFNRKVADFEMEKTEGKRRRGQQRMRLLDSITNSMDINLSKLWEIVKDRGAWQATVHGVSKNQTWLTDWTATTTSWLCKLVLSALLAKKLVEHSYSPLEPQRPVCCYCYSFQNEEKFLVIVKTES